MKVGFARLFRNVDWILLICPLIIMFFGLIELYSIALGSNNSQDLGNFKKQILFALLGYAVYLAIALFLDYRVLNKYSILLYALTVILLLAVLFLGKTINGTTGWFHFAGFSFQPIEFAKLAMIIFLARFLTQKAKYIQQLKYLFYSGAGVFFLVFLVLLQPDFGSAFILLAIWFLLILLTGIKKSHLLTLIFAFVIGLLILWFGVFQNYQKERIRVFLDPSLDPLGRGYNVTQAIIAIGSGQVFGRGVGFGSQSQLKFLPEAQTDFIFAVIAEELGFFGVALVISLYALLFWRLISIARQTRDNFALYVVVGITIAIFIQLVINLGGNLGLLPITGVPLPLISYGGSSMLSILALLGIAQSIAIRKS